ncbi:acetyl-CoA carboxylase biotin carboxylase subunit family protein [Micromonospora sp. NPDC093277]|uniref:ATP-grasp domain-containing protein n=1 Tax=Micromonospora sp. NPDC093277 TaxID=3364291 RepID=UPI00380389EE
MNVLVCRWDRLPLEAVLDRGARVTLVYDEWEAANRSFDPALLARVERVYVIRSFDALDELAQLAVELRLYGAPIDKVLSLSEFSQFGAAYLAQLLGVDEPSVETSVLVRDKRAMKAKVSGRGVRCARFVSLTTTDVAGSVKRVDAELGFPVIVKPVAGLGSVDTRSVASSAELTELLQGVATNGVVQFLMAEEPVRGEEYHVDAVWAGGRVQMLAISRYLKPRMLVTHPGRENGSIILPRAGHAELYARVEAMQAEVNAALEIHSGITHLELFEDAEGQLWFSEIATRYAGGAIPESFRPYGMDLREMWIESALNGGSAPLRLHEPEYPYIGWINLAPGEAGVIRQEPSDEEIAAFPYVLEVTRARGVGFHVESVHPSVWCLLLVIGADSPEQFRQRAAELEELLLPSYRMEAVTSD